METVYLLFAEKAATRGLHSICKSLDFFHLKAVNQFEPNFFCQTADLGALSPIQTVAISDVLVTM